MIGKRKSIRLDIHESHIENAERGSLYFCPIALALIDKGYKRPIVTDRMITLGNDIDDVIIPSRKIRNFIHAFDRGEVTNPVTLKMKVKTYDSSKHGYIDG